MSKRTRLLLRISATLVGVLLVLVVAAVFTLQSGWFANYVRNKIISTTEESTGGRAEIGSFQFDWSSMTVRIRNFVLHGTEPAGSAPLARAALLELRLKLFSGWRKAVDLRYLGIEQPQVHLITFADGRTNIPEPKVKQQTSSNTSGLETVVNLAVGEFNVSDGLLQYAGQENSFSGRGENLRVLLNYDAIHPGYQGSLRIDPLLLAAAPNQPLAVHVNIPVRIDQDSIRLSNVTLNTARSQVAVDAAVSNMRAPLINAHLKANVSLPEMQASLALPIDTIAKASPKTLTADIAATLDSSTNVVQISSGHVDLGASRIEASGSLDRARNSAVQFNSTLALNQLLPLFKVAGVQAAGVLNGKGTARLDEHNNYALNGVLQSRDLSIHSGTTRLSNIAINSPFHADPFLISLDGLKLNAFGGSLLAKIFVEKLHNLSVEGSLRNFSLPVLTSSFTGKRLGYDGTINGTITARGDLKAKGAAGYTAAARLAITPGRQGVPVSGRLSAAYSGARDTVDLGSSYIAMPSSRIDLSGVLNRKLDVRIQSHNLQDFLPAANFGAAKHQTSLPVSLQGGGMAAVTAQINGKLASPTINGHLALDRFAVEGRSFDRFAADLQASPSGAQIQNGLLTRRALSTTFDANVGLHQWSPLPRSPLTANIALRHGDLADLLALAGESSVPATGNLNADVHVNGTYGNPLGSANLQVTDGSAYGQPIDHLFADVALGDQLITLSRLELAAANGQLNGNGMFRHPRDSFSVGHAEVHLASTNVQLKNITPLQKQSPGLAGLVQLTADATADLRASGTQTEFSLASVSADLSARGLRVGNQDAGDLTATARTRNNRVNYDVSSNFAGSNIKVDGNTSLASDYATSADARIENLLVEKALQIVGQGTLPVRGLLSANAHVAGTLNAPDASLRFALTRANVYEEPLNRLAGQVRYTTTAVDVPSVQVDVPAGSLKLSGSFVHPSGQLQTGSLRFKVDSTDIRLAKLQHVQQAKPGLDGTVRLAADLSADVREGAGKQTLLFHQLTADASTKNLRVGALSLGGAEFNAHTAGQDLNFRLDSDIAKSRIHAAGLSHLNGDYPTRATLSFENVRYANLAQFIEPDPAVRPAFDALVEGKASLDGPLLKTDDLAATLQLSRLEARSQRASSPTGAPPSRIVAFQNEGPIDIAFDHSVVQVKQFHVKGPRTTIDLGGRIDLKNQRAPLGVTVSANADLGVLQDVDRDFYSSGALSLNAVVHGTFAQPLLNGKLDLKNANVNYADAPNGLSNANGTILLNGTNASIQNLTAESGGGRVTLAGFVGYTGNAANFNLRASADRVRVRSSGVSITANAALTLTGNNRRSLLNGTVMVERLAYGASSDAGSFLSNFSTPPITPSTPNPVLAGMRLDVHILTSPSLRVVSTYADRLSVEANLTARGTAATPGMLGRVVVTDGELVFFGKKYTVNTGTVNFYNPTSIEPVLNVSLETQSQNVDVVVGVSGPISNLKLSYRSDPPLSFSQIVQLLATNTTPSDPTIASRQPAPLQQSLSQVGESAILEQAVANPLASRVQRVFGISSLKVDPSFSGSNGQPSARVTLQQKITSNITFTYITDVTQTNSQIIRLEWALTPKLSAVGLRDYNGDVSIQFFYKFRVR